MKLGRKLETVLCGAVLVGALSLPVRADVKYTTEMLMGGGGAQTPKMSMTTSVKGKRERVDLDMAMGPMQMHRTTITMCDKRQIVDIDEGAKVYKVSPITPMSRMMPMGRPSNTHHEHKTGTGQIVTTVTVRDAGAEKIGQFDTRHYIVDMQVQSSGCAGNDTSTFSSEMWVAPGRMAFNCGEVSKPQETVDDNGCKITYVMKGDMKKFADIQNGLVVQRTFKSPHGGPTMTQRVSSYSEAALPDSEFNVPSDCRQVSDEEFEQAVMRAMMQKMQGQPQPGGDQ
jgi:hypothetical protein